MVIDIYLPIKFDEIKYLSCYKIIYFQRINNDYKLKRNLLIINNVFKHL